MTLVKLLQVLTLALLLVSMPVGVIVADHMEDGINVIPALVTNNTGADAENVQVPVLLSSQTLINGAFMDADALNTDVREGSEHRAYMPGTARVQMLACFDNSGADETVDCNDAGSDDITLPATGAEVFEFAADNQFRHLHLNISQAAVADWTVQWQYWNGSSYVALSNVSDGTDGFTESGTSRVSWDFPAASLWPESTLHSISGYWVRAEVTSATSITTVPLGQQAWYETGRWWTLAESIGSDEQKRFDAHLDIAESQAITEEFSVAAGADDGSVVGDDAVYPPAFDAADDTGTTIIVSRNVSGGTFRILLGLVRFDTSSLPDVSNITSASVTCQVRALSDDDSRNLVWEWFNWDTSLGGQHYETVAQANAHTGTAISALPSATLTEHTFTLTNLHNINKAGFTGMRVAVDGGQPTGNNTVQVRMQETGGCSLSVTYTTPKDFHFYFPHEDGYTLADAAALEPGDNYHVRWAGFWDMPEDNTSRNIAFFNKGGSDFRLLFITTPNRVTLDVNGTLSYLVSPAVGGLLADSGYHVIDLYQNDEAVTLLVNGEQMDTDATVAVTGNAVDWIFMANNVSPGMEYFEYEVNQVTQFTHQLRDIPDHELTDHTGNGFSATARYPDTDTASGFTVSLQSAQASASLEGAEPAPGPEVIGEVPAVTNFSEVPTPGPESFFLFEIMSDEADESGFPYEAMVGMFAIALTIVGMIGAARIFNSALPMGVGVIICLVILWQMGALPFWMAGLFAIGPMIFFLIWKRATP